MQLFVILYADDILLLSPTVTALEKLLHARERELNWLDMVTNCKKSFCLRIGPRYDIQCADIISLSGQLIPWATEIRYLGIHIVSSRLLKYRRCNFICSKCLPALLYGLEACPLRQADSNSLDFVVNRLFIKL